MLVVAAGRAWAIIDGRLVVAAWRPSVSLLGGHEGDYCRPCPLSRLEIEISGAWDKAIRLRMSFPGAAHAHYKKEIKNGI